MELFFREELQETLVFAQNIGLPADVHSLNQLELMNLSMISATKFDERAVLTCFDPASCVQQFGTYNKKAMG